MKKCGMIMIGAMLALGLTACSGSSNHASDSTTVSTEVVEESGSQEEAKPSESDPEEAREAETKAEETEAKAQEASLEVEEKAGKTLVVYYSATGNTRAAADYIAEATAGEVFELEPREAYTRDDLNWRDENSRVTYEHDNPEERKVELVADTVPDWESYDTVFIGYPIWWGIAAWPVDGFVKANDFTGKTVIPFCTSSSSDLGESGSLLEEMAGTGDWLQGERFPSGATQEEIREWVEGLGL